MFTSCSTQAIQSDQTPTPTVEALPETNSQIIEKMINGINDGDIKGSFAYFSDNAVAYIIGLPPTKIEVYAGKDQIRTLWQDSVDNHF